MLNYFKYLILLFCLSLPINLSAQSPYKLSWSKESTITAVGMAIGIPSIYLNKNITPLSIQEINSLKKENINSFDRFATNYYSDKIALTSDIFFYSALVAPASLLIAPEIRNDWLTVGTMYAETMLLAGATNYLTKGLVERIRPFAYNPDVPINIKQETDTKRSFYSGHTTMAFASAVFVSQVFSDYFPHSKYKPYVWGGTMLFATTVGLLRIFSGSHFPTDVLAGAATGSFIGWLIPELHKKINTENVNMGIGIGAVSFTYVF